MNNQMNYFKAQQWAFSFVKQYNGEKEAVEMLLCGLHSWDRTDLLLHYRDVMPLNEWRRFQTQVQRYVEGEPVQYILGSAPFYGLQFKVTPATLIPRMETEELVYWILQDFPCARPLRVLDIGTGTGAIGLTLKNERPLWKVTLSDIDPAALKVAQQNARNLSLKVDILQSDLFENLMGTYDIIISNPPYIALDEVRYMDQRVLNYEPPQALFAAHHGLALYERLAHEVAPFLKKNSSIYLEIGFKQGIKVSEIFQKQFPNALITVKKDINNNDRMVKIKFEKVDKNGNYKNI